MKAYRAVPSILLAGTGAAVKGARVTGAHWVGVTASDLPAWPRTPPVPRRR